MCASSCFRNSKSTTVDETLYLRGGLAIYWTGSFHVLNENGVAPLPALLTYWLEGLDEALTLQRLGVSGTLYKKLRSTNAIENLNSGGLRRARRT